ncbi:MAG: hypothetical protein ACT4PG_03555 [Panacagrimonas sp.]
MLTNRVLNAAEAADCGLINANFADADALREHVAKAAAALTSGPTRAFGGARRLLSHSAGNSLHEQLRLEANPS